MQKPGVHIETIHNPRRYTYAQIDRGMRDRAEARPRQAGARRTADDLDDVVAGARVHVHGVVAQRTHVVQIRARICE